MNENIYYLAQTLGNKLLANGWQISCAESCTGGGVGYAITGVPGSSAWFKKGFITYSNDAKHDLLGVTEDTLTQHGAVSAATVEEMAAGAAMQANADVAIAISGIAGPDGGTKLKPVGLVYIGIKKGNKIIVQQNLFRNKNRILIQKATTLKVLKTVLTLK